MKELTRLGSVSEMPSKGKLGKIVCKGVELCVANVKGDLRAMDDACPHKGVSLSGGELKDKRVICPKHSWQFKTKNGACKHHSGHDAKIYDLFQIGGDIFVNI